MSGALGGEEGVNVSINAENNTTGPIDEVISNLARLRQAAAEFKEVMEGVGNGIGSVASSTGAAGAVSGFVSVLEKGVGAMGNWISQSLQVTAGMLAWQVFNDAASAVRNLGQEMWQLQVQTEANVYSWRYTYGVSPDQAAGLGIKPQDLGAYNMANAQAISDWSSRFSMNIPFTRQDLMTSISGASMMGLNLQGLEHYYPIIADLAATHVNPMTGQPVNLGQAVMAIRGEMMGYSRMLKYQLNINPEDLNGYAGLEVDHGHIKNLDRLLPALEAYSKEKGWTQFNAQGQDRGAAYTTAHSTWWGESSSFQDRLQNWLLQAGGTDLSGNVRKGSLFGEMKKDLEGISNWMDTHQGQLEKLADIASQLFGGAVHGATSLFEGLFQGLEKSGIGQQILTDLQNAGQWLADPNNQAKLEHLGYIFGTEIGPAVQQIGEGLKTMKKGLDDFGAALGPDAGKTLFHGLVDVFSGIAAEIGRMTTMWADFIQLFKDWYNQDYKAMGGDLQKFAADQANFATFGAATDPNLKKHIYVTGNGSYIVPQVRHGAGGVTEQNNDNSGPSGDDGSGSNGVPINTAGYISSLGGGPGGPGGGIGYVSGSQAVGAWIVGELARGMQSGMVSARSTASSIGQSIADEIRRAFSGGQHLGIGDAIAAAVQRELQGATGYGSVTAGGSWAALGSLGGLGR